MKHKIRRRIRRNVENIHSNIKEFSYQSKRAADSTRKKILPDQYSFWHSQINKDKYRILHKNKMKRRMHRIKRLHSDFKDFMQSTKSGLVSTKKKIIPDDYSFLLSERNRKVIKIVDKVKVFHMNRRNTIILLSSVIFAWFLLDSGILSSVVPSLAKYKYISTFFLGLLFPLGFTTAPVAATLYSLSAYFNPVLMALIAAIGAMIGNLLIFFFVKYELVDEIRYIFTNDLRLDFYKFELNLTKKRLKSKWFRILAPVFSGLLIALPVPTEMIVSILWNINKLDIKYVMMLSFTFSFIGFLCLGILHG